MLSPVHTIKNLKTEKQSLNLSGAVKKICTFRLICVGSVLHPRLTKMQQLPVNKKFFIKVTNCMTKMTQPIR